MKFNIAEKLGYKLTPKQEFFFNYLIIGLFLSIILFTLLAGTKIAVFGIFPLLLAFGAASKIYSAKIKSYEINLFVFLDDLKDLLQGGMNLVTAVEIMTKHDYGSLNEPIKRLSAQINIGIPFETSLDNVFGSIDSDLFKQVTHVISETTKVGGNIIKVFKSVSEYVSTINEMIEERKSKTFSTIFSSYFMFFVFIAIVLIIQIVFLPMLSSSSMSMTMGGAASSANSLKDVNFNKYFLYLIIVQGIFAGPAIGKISEGNAIAGVKHSVILLAIAVPIYVLVSIFFL